MTSHNTSPGWTDERVERLKQLWRDGKSATQIARKLGTTRCAVIGKVHRLGIAKREKGWQPQQGRWRQHAV